MKVLHVVALAAGFVSGGMAIAVPVSCPEPKLVELNAVAEGWKSYTPPNAYDKPAIKFQNMRLNPNNLGDVPRAVERLN
jgi:hypothetical protein